MNRFFLFLGVNAAMWVKVNELTIEVGGKIKDTSQVKHLDNYLIAADDIETGSGNKVPIWLFGFLY